MDQVTTRPWKKFSFELAAEAAAFNA